MLQFACSPMSDTAAFFAFGCSCDCQLDNAGDVTIVEGAIDMATDMIVLLSGGRVYGRCTRVVCPVGQGWCGPLPGSGYNPDGWYPGAQLYPGGDDQFGGADVIPLRGPNTIVNAVTIGGVALPGSSYQLVDRRFLMRVDGLSWPSRNSLIVTNAAHWTIDFSFGFTPDKVTQDAVNEIACELVKDYNGRKSSFPFGGVINANVQGASVQMKDAAEEAAISGALPAVARFLGVYNPKELQYVTSSWTPEDDRGWRLLEVG